MALAVDACDASVQIATWRNFVVYKE